MSGKAVEIEQDVETIKKTVHYLKKKDEEILEILLKTKLLLDRQKIEDIKLSVGLFEKSLIILSLSVFKNLWQHLHSQKLKHLHKYCLNGT